MIRAALYWLGSLLLILILLISIGGLAVWVYSTGQPFHRLWGGFFVVLGFLLLASSFRNPHALWRRHFLRPEDSPSEDTYPGEMISALPKFWGIGLICAGISYAATGNIWVVIATMWIAQLPLLPRWWAARRPPV